MASDANSILRVIDVQYERLAIRRISSKPSERLSISRRLDIRLDVYMSVVNRPSRGTGDETNELESWSVATAV